MGIAILAQRPSLSQDNSPPFSERIGIEVRVKEREKVWNLSKGLLAILNPPFLSKEKERKELIFVFGVISAWRLT